MTSLSCLADDFAAAFARRDVDGVMRCFTVDASYADLFLGVHRGSASLRAMFERMFASAGHSWSFEHVVAGDGRVVAEWRFSVGRGSRVVSFGGVSVFDLDPGSGRCRAYREYFDRGAALVALGTPARVLERVVGRHPTVSVVGG